jgi:NAD(P)-dependent dehydrogenase (short-subunit alcohol dehydrogenase family)
MGSYLIFGASGGIGSSLTRRLFARGSRVFIAGRNREGIEEVARETGADFRIVDATQPSEVELCVSDAVESCGRLDGIAHCVGSVLLKPAHITTDAEWQATIATNLTSAFAVLRAGVKAMMATGGSIVLVSSAAARTGLANHEAIAAAKAGVIGLTLSAAASYGARNIRVNCVAPGMVKTPATARITSSEKALKASTAMHALGRVGEPEDVASMIEWLLHPDNAWVTGQVFGVDGGLGTVRTRGAVE